MAAIICEALCTSSFFSYRSMATVLNAPPIALGVKAGIDLYGEMIVAFDDEQNDCGGNCWKRKPCRGSVWLLVHGTVSTGHVVAAWYIYRKITEEIVNDNDDDYFRDDLYCDSQPPYQREDLPNSTNSPAPKSEAGRAWQVLCHDPKISVYILLTVFYSIWMSIGSRWVVSGSFQTDEIQGSSCPESIRTEMLTGIGFGYVFYSLGASTLFNAFCLAYCRNSTEVNREISSAVLGSNGTASRNMEASIRGHSSRIENIGASFSPYPNDSNAQRDIPTATDVFVYDEENERRVERETKAAIDGSAIGSKVGKTLGLSRKMTSELETNAARASMA
eukprot:CAMPEP_0197466394 /NCGR_PEP_ID=MMETSP1175-20131217/65032_1 /TAXON_ID=1003142 /ORGANISM="Triceratium dubium, Strain CCMP147" /LENGTH=332 /DNA_ID=CAMNT_0043002433 /DNA_START=52 /DNA_END=1046 /DNA_ORIENTATION=-